MNARTGLTYGKSLLLSGVAGSRAECPGVQVARTVTWAEASRFGDERVPDVLIFHLAAACESHVLPLLFRDPHPLMIGLELERNRVVLLSNQPARSLALPEIAAIMERGGRRKVVGCTMLTSVFHRSLMAERAERGSRQERKHSNSEGFGGIPTQYRIYK